MKLRINKKGLVGLLLTGTIVLTGGCGIVKEHIKSVSPVVTAQADVVELSEPFEIDSVDYEETESQEEIHEADVHVVKLLYGYQYVDMNQPGITTDTVNFRTGPTTDYDIIETLNNGTKVQLLAKTSNDWYMIKYNETTGFICGDYVKEIDLNKTKEQMSTMPSLVKAVQATTGVNVRSESNTDCDIITTLHAGDKLEMLGYENGWYQVRINDGIGYVSGDYVTETYILSGEYTKLVYMNGDVNLVDEPYGAAITTLPSLEVGYVYGETDDYYFIESNGLVGYVPKSCVGSLHDVYVVVDISDQVLKLYNGTELILTSDIVSGKNETPSDYGIFNIYYMGRDEVLEGPGYSCPVDYWMPYNGGEGLHDASWRYSFGGDIYEYSGSHGCINCPNDTARTIYENAYVGTQVLVKK